MKKANIIAVLSVILLCSAYVPLRTGKSKPATDADSTNAKASVKTIVVLGNSIVHHVPNSKLGWNGNWGMAASAEDKDFVHLLIKDIQAKNPKAVVKYANVSPFERNYKTYDLAQLDEYKNPDMLILKLSENVSTPTAVSDSFVVYYDKLIKYLAPKEKQVKIIMDGFFNKPLVNGLVKTYATQNKYPFVQISDLSANPEATAKGLFENKDVANHPSDLGMSLIEKRLWDTISKYFE